MGRKRKDLVRKRPDSPFWHYDWTTEGHRLRGSTETTERGLAEEIALERRRAFLRRIKLAESGAQGAAEMTLDQALERCLLEHWRHQPAQLATVPYHCRDLLRLIGPDTLMSKIDDAVVADFIARRRGEPVRAAHKLVSPATVNRAVVTLRTAMTRARRWKLEGRPVAVAEVDWPRHRLKERAVETFLTRNQAEALLAALVPHARAPARLALMTGLRRSAVLGLDWARVDLAGRRLVLPVKGGKLHTVSLIPEAADLLAGLAPDPADRHGPVFVFGAVACGCPACRPDHGRGRELTGRPIRSIKRAFATARKAIGLPDLRFHDLRHTVASWLLQDGHSLKVVQKVLGHQDIGTTARYAHLEQEMIAEAMAGALGDRSRRKA